MSMSMSVEYKITKVPVATNLMATGESHDHEQAKLVQELTGGFCVCPNALRNREKERYLIKTLLSLWKL